MQHGMSMRPFPYDNYKMTSGSRYDVPQIDHDKRQAFLVLIFMATQRGSSYIKDSS